jgi:hypothetical protein
VEFIDGGRNERGWCGCFELDTEDTDETGAVLTGARGDVSNTLVDGVGSTTGAAAWGSSGSSAVEAFADVLRGWNDDLGTGACVEVITLLGVVETGSVVGFAAAVTLVDARLVGQEHVGVSSESEGTVGGLGSLISHAASLHGGIVATRELAHFYYKKIN